MKFLISRPFLKMKLQNIIRVWIHWDWRFEFNWIDSQPIYIERDLKKFKNNFQQILGFLIIFNQPWRMFRKRI